MSTEINIKKKLAILEEGASVTTDATSIDFVGSGVNASTVGNDVTITIPGNSGNTTYYLNESITQAPYKEFSSLPTAAAEQVVPLTVLAGATSVIAEYQTPSGVPGTTQIPAGLWQLFLHFNAGAAGQNWIIRPTVYKRDLGGIETLLFTPDPEIVTGMSTTTTMYVCDGVFPASTILTTDRIVVRISMQNTTGVSQTVNFRTEGSQHYSVGLTTLNQVVPTGAVTSVTGTAPIVSSGGTTPAISIPQSSATVDGYLSSSDWAVFNAKVPATRNITINGTTYDLSADRTWNVGTVTSVAALTLGTTGTDLSSSIATGTTTPVITLNIPTASASNRGALSSTDWSTFNSKQNTISLTTTGTSGASTLVGNTLNIPQYAGGLTYFTEAQSTTAPNATVNVDSLTAIASTTNADFVIRPKGTGAIIGAIPDGTTTGGDKRGTRSVDFQLLRGGTNQIASGNFSALIAGENNRASGLHSIGLGGYNNVASGVRSVVSGTSCIASGTESFAGGSSSTASSDFTFAYGLSALANQYGSVALGTGAYAGGNHAISLGRANNATGASAFSSGYLNVASGENAVALNTSNTASGMSSFVIGEFGSSFGVTNRFVFSGRSNILGSSQSSKLQLGLRTTGATPSALVVQYTLGTTPSASNQLTLQDNNVFRVKGSITGKQSGSTNVGVWDIDCVIVRGTTAASTVIAGTPTVSLVVNTGSFGIPTLTANTTLGCLTVTVIGVAATNIQWTCAIDTCETIYA